MVKNITSILFLSIGLLFSQQLVAQQEELLITQKSGGTFIYQNKELRNGAYLDVYRKQGDATFEKLNKKPIEMIKDGSSFRNAIGVEAYQQLENNLETKSAMATYLEVLNDRSLRLILSFSNPEISEAFGYLFVDEGSITNQNYTYKLVYRNQNDSSINNEKIVTHLSMPYQPKPAVDLGIAVVDDEQLEISWQVPNENTYISGFNIYAKKTDGRSIKINKNLILKTTNNNFTYRFSLPFDNTTYKFYMKSQDMTGQEGASSEVLSMTLKDQTPPESVAGLVVNSVKGEPPVITWKVNLENDLMGYNVYRAPRTIDPFVKINDKLLSPYENFFKDETVAPGRKYAYVVTAVDSAENESEKSSRATVFIEDYELPDAPQNLVANYNESTEHVALSWEYNFDKIDFRTFQITRQIVRNGEKSAFETVNSSILRNSNFIDMGPTSEGFLPGYIYNYHVIAIDSSTNASDTASLVFQIPDLDPPAPPEISAKNDNGHRINIVWTASADYDVVAYRIYRSLNGRDSLLSENHYSERLYRDESAQKGNSYIYTVTAIDSLGNEGIKSIADTIPMKDFDPPAPTRNVAAVAGKDGILLSWEQVPDKDLAGYNVYRSAIATGLYELVSNNIIQNTTFTDVEGVAGVWYKVKGVDSSGNEAYIKNGVQAITIESQ